jgi:hypothetical protein
MTRAKSARRAGAKPKAKRKSVRARKAPEPRRGATPEPEEEAREREDLESIEDPLEDWPEEADSEEDRWLIERKGEDVENPGEG